MSYMLLVSHLEPLIPHTEHPTAYGGLERRMVRFLQPHTLSTQQLETCHNGSSVSSPMSTSPPRSTRSPNGTSPTMDSKNRLLKTESRRVEYDFEEDAGESILSAL